MLAVAREALTNILRHAGATAVLIDLTTNRKGAPLLRIRDNGRGFTDANQSRHTGVAGGNGLRNMRVRAATIGARLTIRSRIGRGTDIRLTLPAPDRKPAHT
jgi:signal transduction histidine kinase